MGNFVIFLLLLGILGFLIKHLGAGRASNDAGQVTLASTDLLSLLLQLTKACAQLEALSLTANPEIKRQKVNQLQALLDAERKRLVGRLREAGVSELAIQQASSVE